MKLTHEQALVETFFEWAEIWAHPEWNVNDKELKFPQFHNSCPFCQYAFYHSYECEGCPGNPIWNYYQVNFCREGDTPFSRWLDATTYEDKQFAAEEMALGALLEILYCGYRSPV